MFICQLSDPVMTQLRLAAYRLTGSTFQQGIIYYLGDLKTRKRTGTSCQIEIHFASQTSKFPIRYNLRLFQISGGLLIFFTEHDYKVSTSFIKENKRYKS